MTTQSDQTTLPQQKPDALSPTQPDDLKDESVVMSNGQPSQPTVQNRQAPSHAPPPPPGPPPTQPIQSHPEEEQSDAESEFIELDPVTGFSEGLSPFFEALGLMSSNKPVVPSTSVDDIVKPIHDLFVKTFAEQEGEDLLVSMIGDFGHAMFEAQELARRDPHAVPLNYRAHTEYLIKCIFHYISLHSSMTVLRGLGSAMSTKIELLVRHLLNLTHVDYSCNYGCRYVADESATRLLVLQSAIHRRFPLLVTSGATCLSRDMVFYGCPKNFLFRDSKYSENERISFSWQCMQTTSCFKQIPTTKREQQGLSAEVMDVNALQNQIDQDIGKGRAPVVVFASYDDDLEALHELCGIHGMWLHVEEDDSDCVLLCASSSWPKQTKTMMRYAHSIACNAKKWFEVAELNGRRGISRTRSSSVGRLLFMKQDSRNFKETDGSTIAYGNSSLSLPVMADMFALWHLLETVDIRNLRRRVEHTLMLCSYFRKRLSEVSEILSTIVLGGMSPHVLVFGMIPNVSGGQVKALNDFHLSPSAFSELVLDKCKSRTDALKMHPVICDDSIVCLKFDVLKYEPFHAIGNTTKKDIDLFVKEVVGLLTVLTMICDLRLTFVNVLKQKGAFEHEEIEVVDLNSVTGFVSLCCFRFTPKEGKKLRPESLGMLNEHLCRALKGEGNERSKCQFSCSVDVNERVVTHVDPTDMIMDRLGTIASSEEDEKNIEELGRQATLELLVEIADQILLTCQNLVFPNEVMNEISSLLQKAILSANAAVVQDQLEKEMSMDAMVRSVPLIGSVYGWFASDGTEEMVANDGQGGYSQDGPIVFDLASGHLSRSKVVKRKSGETQKEELP